MTEQDMTNTGSSESDVQTALKRLGTRAMGLTGADVERIVREARQVARRQKRLMRYQDLEDGIRMHRPQLPHDLRWRFAVHEAGHAIVHHVLKLGPIQGITIDMPDGGYSLLAFQRSGSDMLSYREDLLVMLLAGRAAEQIVFCSVSVGSAGSDDSDLARATGLALALERSLGFGAVQPLLYRDDKDPTPVLDAHPDLAARVHARLEKALAKSMDVLNGNRKRLDRLTAALFEQQVLDGDVVLEILNEG
ncbi:ATP-dependent Zn protease [Rhizobium sp. AAP116]|uniref:ATP-dependent Zn protease n=1 Tax=Rhizobium sp. AAP116 TaxID=1523429 RepID=UPI0006B9C774|nr:ATP-dependent Zn protease [Rhizobium sp. AAP116]KPF58735.1 ATP-dependent Zn protease [Rhizobium sp. AAP116]